MARHLPAVALGVTLILALAGAPRAAAKDGPPDTRIDLPERPTTIEDFLAFRDRVATTPEGGVAVFLVAAWMYSHDQDLGLDALTIAYHRDRLRKAKDGYKGFRPARSLDFYLPRVREKPWLFRAYVEGAHPGNGYALPAKRTVALFRNRYSDLGKGKVKVFARNSGAASPRPFTLEANRKGLWKVREASSFFTGMREPEDGPDPDEVDDL